MRNFSGPIDNADKGRRPRRGLKVVLFTILGIWAAVTIALQIVLSTSFLERTADRIASKSIDGSLTYSGIEASMFRSFPNLEVTLDDFSLTYPHGRFSGFDPAEGEGSFFRNAGRSEEGDTLAHFDRFKISLNYLSLLKGRVNVRKAVLEHPRIFLRQYDSTAANWKMFLFTATEEEKEDSSTFSLPSISVGKAILEGRPLVYYSSLQEALSASLSMSRLSLGGDYSSRRTSISRLALGIDSMMVAGRAGADTLAVAVESLKARSNGDNLGLSLKSDVLLALSSTGRMAVPLDLNARMAADFRGKVYEIKDLDASVATIDIKGHGLADLSGDVPYLKAVLSTDREPVKEAIRCIEGSFPVLKKLDTDALVSIQAECDGFLSEEGLPSLKVDVEVPGSRIAWEGMDDEGRFDMDVTVFNSDGRFEADVRDFCFSTGGLELTAKGHTDDFLEDDPKISLEAVIHAELDSLTRFLPDSLQIMAEGQMDGKVRGSFRISELDPWNFSGTGLRGSFSSPGIKINDVRDTLWAHLGKTDFTIDELHEDGEDGHSEVGLTATIDTIYAEYGKAMFIRGSGFQIMAHNPEEVSEGADGAIHGHLDIRSAAMRDVDSNFVAVAGSSTIFGIERKYSGKEAVPYLNLTSDNGRVLLRFGENMVSTGDFSLYASAHPANVEKKALKKHLNDSLRVMFPHQRFEDDFEKKDLRFHLDEGLADLFKEWELSGGIKLGDGSFISPYFPLFNRLKGLSCSVTNNAVNLRGLKVKSGRSDISAKGSLTGLKRALVSGKGRLNLNLDIESGMIDLNELLAALDAGSRYEPRKSKTAIEAIDDAGYMETVVENAAIDTSKAPGLIVIPSNINARVCVEASKLKYSELETSWIYSELQMRDRCLQMTNTMATTNMGDVHLEGFYSTRSKDDIKAGFVLNFAEITAEKVISLFPAVDSIIPMLKAFKGQLDCEIAATSDIDTTMSIIPSSISGVVRIDGKELSLSESESLDRLRRTMMFKDKTHSDIDNMSVRGVIRNNTLEIFPFILKIDRYTVALDGTQKFDQNFKYHISAIESPVPVKFGVNLKGSFSDWKWSLGKARYKSTGIPVFDDQVNNLRASLLGSIRSIFDRGVENAIRQNRQAQEAIEARKAELEYSSEETEELSEGELMELESYEAGEGTGSPAI